jgi:hypothetical protein
VTEDALKTMTAGSVIVDMGASPLGGNVTGSRPGETIVTGNGITIIGADNLPATVPTAASNAYSRNISALLLHLTKDGALAIDTGDDIQAGVVITHDGRVVHADVAGLLAPPGQTPGETPAETPAEPPPPAPVAGEGTPAAGAERRAQANGFLPRTGPLSEGGADVDGTRD